MVFLSDAVEAHAYPYSIPSGREEKGFVEEKVSHSGATKTAQSCDVHISKENLVSIQNLLVSKLVKKANFAVRGWR